jgi:small-conductance mechanosensitive channel
MKFEINLIAGIVVLLALLAALTAGGRALYHAGYDSRVSQEATAYASAEAKGQKAQAAADAKAIQQLQDAADAAAQAVSDRDARLTKLTQDNTALAGRLHALSQTDAQAAGWLATPIPGGILNSVCWAASCPSAAPADSGH